MSTQYELVSGFDIPEFQRQVNLLIRKGYEPQGGISVAVIPQQTAPNAPVKHAVRYSQAMVNRAGQEVIGTSA